MLLDQKLFTIITRQMQCIVGPVWVSCVVYWFKHVRYWKQSVLWTAILKAISAVERKGSDLQDYATAIKVLRYAHRNFICSEIASGTIFSQNDASRWLNMTEFHIREYLPLCTWFHTHLRFGSRMFANFTSHTLSRWGLWEQSRRMNL